MHPQPQVENEVIQFRYTFTVFTPTYNRAHTLHRVYESLCAQTYQSFEWLIVNDGSTDHTEQLVQQWQQSAPFPIRYHRQENSGKHIAYNYAAKVALGEFVVNLDSDDACVPEALERFQDYWNQIPPAQRSKYSGIDCLCQDTEGKIIGDRFPQSPMDSHVAEIRYRLRISGEKWGMQRTDVLREFPFPDVQGRRLEMPESIVWTRLTRQYPARYVNDALRIYYTNGADQITRARWAEKDTRGFFLSNQTTLNYDLDYFWYAPRTFIKAAANCSRAGLHCGYPLRQQVNSLTSISARLLWLSLLPLGFVLWFRDTRQ